MAASKSGFMKDALILFAITLVSGLCLGVVYDVTKAPIEAATIAANNATYKQVLPEAESFDECRNTDSVRNDLTQCGDQQVGKHQYGCCGKSHAETVDGRCCRRKSRTHT